MAGYSDAYAVYREKQTKLVDLLQTTSDILASLGMNQDKGILLAVGEKVNNDAFKIQVVGTFKNGKSTFINSFLGEEILPAYATPCTAVINEVKYGASKKAFLHFKRPLPRNLPGDLPEKVRVHMQRYAEGEIPPLEISYGELEDYAVIPMDKELKDMSLESPYEKIELCWPLELLENSVEIVDSPGLNEHATRTQVTTGYLSKADAILFVLTADKLCSADEMKFIETNLNGLQFHDIYFVVNRFDVLRNEVDRQRTVALARAKLSPCTSFGEDGIFFVSALEALEGKLRGDDARYQGSGMPLLERELSDFLVHQKGEVKLRQPAELLKHAIGKTLRSTIPQQRSGLESTLEELNARVETQRPRLEAMQEKREKINERMEKKIRQMDNDGRDCATQYFEGLYDRIPVWVDEYQSDTKISRNPMKTKESVAALATEIFEDVKVRIDEETLIWQQETLGPLISAKVDDLRDSVEENLESMFFEMDSIKINISGAENVEAKNVPVWQRVAAAGVGLWFIGIEGAALGGMEGFSKDFFKGVAMQAGGFIVLNLLGVVNPIAFVAAALLPMVMKILNGNANLEQKVKEKIAEHICDEIAKKQNDSIEKMINQLINSVEEIKAEISNAMDIEVAAVYDLVDTLIQDLEKGQDEVERKREALTLSEKQLRDIAGELDRLYLAKKEEMAYA